MVVQELIAKLGFDVDQGGLNSVDNALGNFAKKLTLAAAGIYAVKKAVEATVWAISGSIEAAAQKEDVTTQFKVMLGDLEAAKYLYQEINQYAAVSPFETAGLADGVKGLMSAGMSAKAAFTDIKMMGDIALGNQEKLNRLSYVYGQTQSAHKLKGDDLRQYTEQGFSPLEVMSRKTGKSIEYYRKEMEKGRFTADMVRESLVIATSEGGRFYNGALEGSKTWNGMLSTARDNLRMLGAELGDRMLPFLKGVLKAFSDLWPQIAGSYRALADFFGIMFENGPSAITWAETLVWLIQKIADAFMFVGIMIQTLIVDFQGLASAIAVSLGFVMDVLMAIPKTLLAGFMLAAKGVLWLGKMAAKVLPKGAIDVQGIAGMQAGADEAWGQLGLNDPFAWTNQAYGNSKDTMDTELSKLARMAQKIGTTSDGSGPMKASDRINALLSGAAGKQPVTINNQTNNLTINADDPIKMMGEAAAGKFFQSAFIQLRHATV
jgi:tape measure domain-containing protein